MSLSGKYNFKGIKKLGSASLKAALSTSPYTAWLLKFGSLLDLILEFVSNWLANKGLVLLNVGAIEVDGYFDQKSFDANMDKAYNEIRNLGGVEKMTPQQKKDIDDAVIKAARNFIVIGSK